MMQNNLKSIHYTSMSETMKLMRLWGQGTQIAKPDIKRVDKTDRLLLGMVWKKKVYINSLFMVACDHDPKFFDCLANTFQ